MEWGGLGMGSKKLSVFVYSITENITVFITGFG